MGRLLSNHLQLYYHHYDKADSLLKLRWDLYTSNDSGYIFTIKITDKTLLSNAHEKVIARLIESIPTSILVKDRAGSYLYANAHHTKAARSSSIIGKIDYDLPWAASADLFKKHDQHSFALKEKPYHFIEQQTYTLTNGKKQLNLMFCATHNKGNELYGVSLNLKDIKNSLLVNYAQKSGAADVENVQLSTREMECVNWIIEGKSSAEIAIILGLSKNHRVAY